MPTIPKKVFSILDIIYPVRDKYPHDQRLCFDPKLNSLVAASYNLSITFNFTSLGLNFMSDLGIKEITYIPWTAVVGLRSIKKVAVHDDICDIYQEFVKKHVNTGIEEGVDIFVSTTQHLVGKHPVRRNLEEVSAKYSIKSLFDDEEIKPVKKFVVTQAKRKFDRIIDSLNKEVSYTITDEITYARGECEEENFHFELAVVTPKYGE